MKLQVHVEKWPPPLLRIAECSLPDNYVVIVNLHASGVVGRAEAVGVRYRGESHVTMVAQIEAVRERVEAGVTRRELLQLLPAGGARNALDCALWELEAKHNDCTVWEAVGQKIPQRLLTTFTVDATEPEATAKCAMSYVGALALKINLTGNSTDADCVRAVRSARPDVWLAVDANQGFTRASFWRLLPALLETGVMLIEQPFPIGSEEWLDGLNSPIRIAADESVQDHTDLARVVGRVDVVNIKLDKCGGLTEAFAMAAQAHELGFDLIVGNMGGSSLAMAPAFMLGQLCEIVDLDGPIFLKENQLSKAIYKDGHVMVPEEVWGSPRAIG